MKIVAAQPLRKQTLEVHDHGISYNESSGFGMGASSHFSFDQIDAVVRSATDPILSIQVGTNIIKLPIKKDDQTHNAVIAQIVAGAQQTVTRAGVVEPV